MSYIVDAIVGSNKKAECFIAPSACNSVISKEFLNKYMYYERLEVDKNKKICLYDDQFIQPLYIVSIPITFKDRKNELTIDSKINVISKNDFPEWFSCDIILGYDWLVGGSVSHEDLQIYSIQIVYEFEWSGVTQPFLSIKCLGSCNNNTLYKKINFNNYKLVTFSESDSSSESDIELFKKINKIRKLVNN